jgi:hypothetical protein
MNTTVFEQRRIFILNGGLGRYFVNHDCWICELHLWQTDGPS